LAEVEAAARAGAAAAFPDGLRSCIQVRAMNRTAVAIPAEINRVLVFIEKWLGPHRDVGSILKRFVLECMDGFG
jgi:hypothetical protein